MARPVWKGQINFGLVNIPVGLYPAEKPNELKFRMLDKRNLSPIRYKRVNAASEDEVPWDQIVKGFEYESDEFVLMSDADFKKARPEATQSITITDFVDCHELHPIFYDKPYYLVPEKKSRRSFALLREAMRRTCKVGIAQVVIHTREHLAAVVVYENALVVELMRFADELRPLEEHDLPGGIEEMGIGEKEVRMAERLIEDMIEPWQPERYRDHYRQEVMGLIQGKIESGQTHQMASEEDVPVAEEPAEVVDMMELLKRSLRSRGIEDEASEEATGTEGGPVSKKTAGKSAQAARSERKPRSRPKKSS